uniref:Alternative protein TNK1 n=1 Tax=Homo sapiens TaxID=9606 RepID=L8E7K1_HUMAN|nr:alternative protein TNK1 [Homo sapiens]
MSWPGPELSFCGHRHQHEKPRPLRAWPHGTKRNQNKVPTGVDVPPGEIPPAVGTWRRSPELGTGKCLLPPMLLGF